MPEGDYPWDNEPLFTTFLTFEEWMLVTECRIAQVFDQGRRAGWLVDEHSEREG